MHRFRVISLAGAAIVVFAGLSPSAVNASPLPSGPAARHHHAACAATGSGHARCFVDVVDHGASDPTPAVTPAPSGLSPTTMASAYNFPTASTAGAGATVAIVDAYNDPTAQSDLNAFDTQYGLSCNACLTKVNQSGGTSYPSTDGGWALEISLDVQWVHAIAPGAQILLVEASSNSFNDLLTAEVYAANHAQYVSNSWGGGEFNGESSYDSAFTQSGVSYFVAAGDNGLPAEYPSASPDVISVGGTTLNNIGAPNFSETAWSGGGGGCSAYESATSAQAHYPTYDQFNANCSGSRATPDVALDADPNSGAAVYDSTPYSGSTGWFQIGGTSLATPMWAAESAVAGGVMNSSRIYGSSNTAPTFRDITSGNNGAPALVGYDLASGLGSWAAYPSGPPPPTTVPGAPTGLGATPGNTSVALVWTAPASTGGSPITGYNVFKGTTSGGEGITPVNASPLAANAASYNATGLPNGTTYFFTVKAVNGVGSSVPSNEASATPTGSATVPGAPTGLAAHTATSKGVTLTWSAPASNGGATITGYRLNRSTRSGRETSYVPVNCTANTCSYTDSRTNSRTTYYYNVAATNRVGTGPVSNQASAMAR